VLNDIEVKRDFKSATRIGKRARNVMA